MGWGMLAFGDGGWGDELFAGVLVSIALALTSYIIGTALGLGLALLGLGSRKQLARLAKVYGVVFRSIPELLILFLVYYGAGIVLSAALSLIGADVTLSLSSFWAGVVALSMVHAAYAAEVFVGALRAVPVGLREAAAALGLSDRLGFRKVILPVALRYAFAGLTNLWMVMIKNTPLVSAIGLADLIGQASTAGENTKAYFLFFLVALAVYLLISGLSMVLQDQGQRHLFRHLPGARV